MTLTRDPIPSPNYSARGSGVRLIVLHTAEGSTSYQSLGAYFASSSSGVSSHVGIDDTPGRIGVYVAREYKAWTQGNANPYSVAAELCAFAAWGPDEWAAHFPGHAVQHRGVGRRGGRRLRASPSSPSPPTRPRGGLPGCANTPTSSAARRRTHWDCGPHMPMKPGPRHGPRSGTTTTGGGAVEIALQHTERERGLAWICGSDGGVFTYGDAPFHGSLGNVQLEAPIVGMTPTPSGKG